MASASSGGHNLKVQEEVAELRELLKALRKEHYLAEEKAVFAKHVAQLSQRPDDHHELSRDVLDHSGLRKQAKERTRARKHRIHEEEERCSVLLSRVDSDHEELMPLKQQYEAKSMASVETVNGEETAAEVEAEFARSTELRQRVIQEKKRLESARLKKRELQAKHVSLQESDRSSERKRQARRKLEALDAKHADSLEQLTNAEVNNLGRPRGHYEDNALRSVLVLEGKLDREVPSDLRTVNAEYDEQSRLIRAEAHPSLGLERAAAKAVELNDLGRLVSQTWAKVRQSTHAGA